MKSVSLLFASILLFSSLLFAYQRGIAERLNGDGFLPQTQSITLDRKVETISGEEVDSIILTTPLRTNNGDRLKLDGKRSIIRIDETNIGDLDNKLKNAIMNVVSNKSKALRLRNLKYRKSGLQNFYVLGNFEAAREVGRDHEWFVAIIPKDVEVEKVIFQTEWFGSGAGAHNQVRMILDTPVVVIPQVDDIYTPMILDFYKEGYKSKGDIVYTLQATRVEGGEQDWQPLSGVMGEFGNALQFFDTRTLMVDQISRSVIDEHSLDNLSKEAGKAILDAAITIADDEQETGIYNTVFASCVTYALKALKAGIPAIDTTWFNPYSIAEKVSQAHGKGTTFVGSSMNDKYGPYLDGKEMTHQKIAESNPELTTAIRAIRKPILEQEAFDDIVQKIALYINQEGITYDQVKAFITEANKPEAIISKIPKTQAGQKLITKIGELWAKSFDGRPIEDFFKALKGLQTQETAASQAQQ